ncbi:hypothetical protein TCAL_01105 [Tigriopus californicus]|uniref:DRBM domain-containing protein n=1 Tax=Tigriopus californicus TaxID=6832 RepID=A0A553P331_TIGCA|nr:hypothetical protein TCAL_01105 [Tigriopus californicus]
MHSPGHASNHHLVVTSYALQAPPPYSPHAHHPPALSSLSGGGGPHSPHQNTTRTTEGASHCPTFAYQVIVDGKVAMGSGSSKKQAKHNAARSMLDKLDGRVPVQDFVQPLPPVSSSVGQGVMVGGKGGNAIVPGAPNDLINSAAGNSIGQLQELCVHKGLQMPMYDVKAEEGQPHQRSFHMVVRVGSLSAEGEGASKKDAKREAAVKMISRVHEYLANHPELDADIKPLEAQIGVIKTEPSDSSASSTSGVEKKIKTLTPKESKEIQSFYRDLSDEPGSLLHKLQTLSLKPLKSGYVSQLEALAKEQKFGVTFVEIEDATDEGDTQCLVQLSSLPVAVALGLGPDKERAKEQAARNGLIYLKMMTCKSTEQSKVESSETKTEATTTTTTPAPTPTKSN